jgi:hypothetical protein
MVAKRLLVVLDLILVAGLAGRMIWKHHEGGWVAIPVPRDPRFDCSVGHHVESEDLKKGPGGRWQNLTHGPLLYHCDAAEKRSDCDHFEIQYPDGRH